MDWDLLPGLKGSTYSWLLGGLFAAGMGVYILQLRDVSTAGSIVAGAFLLVGLYLTTTAFSYARTLIVLRRTTPPTKMLLTITGRENNHKDYYAELRYLGTPAGEHCDIHAHLAHLPGLKKITPGTKVDVYGAYETNGPIIIETELGPVWSSGPGGVNRHSMGNSS